jgi:hypothetical protein
MKRIVLISCLLIIFLSCFWGCTRNTNRYYVANFDDDKLVETFAARFKELVLKQEKGKVSLMILYPIRAHLKDRVVVIQTANEFLKFYDQILDKQFVDKIGRLKIHNMWANYQGVMLGDGDVWFGTSCADCNDIKVVAVGICRQ